MQANKQIDLVIFDCDGVLIDSEILSQGVLLSLLKDKGVDVDAEYFNAHFLGRTFECVTQKVAEDFGVVLADDFRTLFRETLFTVFDKELVATPDIKAILTSLKVKSCVATSSSPARVAHALKVAGLGAYFEERVFTASLVNKGKPAPDIFLYAAQQMGVDPKHCLVIEDSLSGIRAGLAAGMAVIQYNGASHMQHLKRQSISAGVTVMSSWQQMKTEYADLFN